MSCKVSPSEHLRFRCGVQIANLWTIIKMIISQSITSELGLPTVVKYAVGVLLMISILADDNGEVRPGPEAP